MFALRLNVSAASAAPAPAGVILPRDVLARLRVGPGDVLRLTESPDGVRLTASDPEFEAGMELAEEIMREDRRILRALAK